MSWHFAWETEENYENNQDRLSGLKFEAEASRIWNFSLSVILQSSCLLNLPQYICVCNKWRSRPAENTRLERMYLENMFLLYWRTRFTFNLYLLIWYAVLINRCQKMFAVVCKKFINIAHKVFLLDNRKFNINL